MKCGVLYRENEQHCGLIFVGKCWILCCAGRRVVRARKPPSKFQRLGLFPFQLGAPSLCEITDWLFIKACKTTSLFI